jgi:hypothetical protein
MVLAGLLGLPTMREIVNSLIAAVACRFIQDRHTGRYLGSKRMTILVGNSLHVPLSGGKYEGGRN